jgi:tetratricopeptide (TPR) repeat protein
MVRLTGLCKLVALQMALALSAPAAAFAQTDRLDALFEELRDPARSDWEEVETQIWEEWSESGSPTMDLLLLRGREAMEAGDLDAAIDELTALTDHAPTFAEGWNARATAYFQQGEFGLSLSDIETTLALNPRHFGALSGLGIIMEELGYDRDALTAYRAAHAIHPRRPDIEDAIKRLEKALGGQEL